MAYVAEESVWKEGVYQLEERDPVLGGPNGISNQPSKDLACRTRYLYDRMIGLNQIIMGREIHDWVVTATVSAGTEVTLPASYEVGSDTLMLFCDATGYIGPNYFSEVGEDGTRSQIVTFTFELPVGVQMTEVVLASGDSGASGLPDDTMPKLQQALTDVRDAVSTVEKLVAQMDYVVFAHDDEDEESDDVTDIEGEAGNGSNADGTLSVSELRLKAANVGNNVKTTANEVY